MAPDTTNNTYMLEVDGGTCYIVGGGSAIPASAWTWVDYQNGNASSLINVSLTAGSHTLKMIGNSSGVKLNRIVLTGDTACVPTGTGDNCANPPDTTPPSVSLTSPTNGSTISGKYTMNATANDDSGTVSKVEFYVDGALKGTSTTSPYSYALDTTTLTNASHSLTAKAYDPSGNVGTSSTVTVTVKNTTTTLPDTTPPTVSITAPVDGNTVSGSVNVTATAADNVGVTKVDFLVDGTLKTTVQTAPYSYSWSTTALSNGTHSVSVIAYDAAGNTSTDSASVTVQNGDTQAPSVPAGLSATAAAYNKVNLAWTASTDNVGVTGYYVVRNGVTIAQIGSVTTYSDTTVSASTQYKYQLIAHDAAGNVSAASAVSTAATATTPSAPDTTPPSTPTGLNAAAVSTSQINLTWTGSTDNVGVTGYDVYRAVGTAAASKVATVNTTSFGDSGLSASTTYTYYVIAKDAANNQSPHSGTASATTLASSTSTGVITGTVSGRNGSPLTNARISLYFNNSSQTYSTNSTGAYTIPGIPVGSYHVHYSARRYHSISYTITVPAGQTITKNVTLRHR